MRWLHKRRSRRDSGLPCPAPTRLARTVASGGTVPVLDMTELRPLGAYLLSRTQRLQALLASGITRAANARLTWTGWGPAAGGGDRSLATHLVIGRAEVYHGFSRRLGWSPVTRSRLGCAGRAVSGEPMSRFEAWLKNKGDQQNSTSHRAITACCSTCGPAAQRWQWTCSASFQLDLS